MIDPPLLELVRSALRLSITLTLPIVLGAAIGGVAAGALQSATRVHDAAVAHVGRLVGAGVATALVAPSIGRALVAFFAHALAVATA